MTGNKIGNEDKEVYDGFQQTRSDIGSEYFYPSTAGLCNLTSYLGNLLNLGFLICHTKIISTW